MSMEIVINDETPVGGSLDVEYEKIEVTSLSKPDLNWEFIDANGHFHAYSADGKLPTIRYREEYVHVESSGGEDEEYADGYSITHAECAICGEEIRPGKTSSTFREFAQGRMNWKVTIAGLLVSGQRYSVRVTNGDVTRFGIAVADTAWWRSTSERAQTVLVGVSPLGERKARASATVGG